jgi:peptide/nickel transport system permease protein
MGQYIARRLLHAAGLLLAVIVLTFGLVHLAPGDPIYVLAGDSGDPAYYAEMRARFGLDRPLLEQLAVYLANVARGDLGYSYIQKQAVWALILGRLPATVLLVGSALTLATALGLVLGTLAARRAGSPLDHLLAALSAAVYGLPVFWLGQLLVLLFAVELGWFPVQGMTTARGSATGLALVGDVARHAVLPATTLALHVLPPLLRVTRGSVGQVLASDSLRTARAKGLGGRVLWSRHVLRNALLPVVTLVGGQAGPLLTGAVLVEITFAWPGLGRLLYDAVAARDYPVLLGIFVFVALAVVLANLLTDLVCAALDPRVRYA